MLTSGSGTPYIHPNVWMSQTDSIYAFGPYIPFRTQICNEDVKFITVRYPTDLIVQGSYLDLITKAILKDTVVSQKSHLVSSHTSVPYKLMRKKQSPFWEAWANIKRHHSAAYLKELADFRTIISKDRTQNLNESTQPLVLIGGNLQLSRADHTPVKDNTWMNEMIELFKKTSKEQKLKIPKATLPKEEEKIEASSYYQVIHYTPKDLCKISKNILQDDLPQDYAHDLVKALRKYVHENRHNDVQDKMVHVTKTGYDLNLHADQLLEFEWSSKSNLNAIYALMLRQVSSRTNIHKSDMIRFTNMCSRFWTYFKQEWDLTAVEPQSFMEQLDAKNFDDTKKLKYAETILKQKIGALQKFVGSGFKTMVKSGEVYQTDRFDLTEYG